ncbi:unnamed protein product, partial [Mesorhabditis spiculigera]
MVGFQRGAQHDDGDRKKKPFFKDRKRTQDGKPQRYGYIDEPVMETTSNKKIKFSDSDEEEDGQTGEIKSELPSGRPQQTFKKNFDKDAHRKPWRLIIRNLPFDTKTEDLQNECSKHGPFTQIVLPKCKNPKFPDSCAGFAFIQFKERDSAQKFREFFNSNTFKNRSVAVDFALDKDTYETTAHKEKTALQNKVKEEQDEKPDVKPVKTDDDDEAEDEIDEDAEDTDDDDQASYEELSDSDDEDGMSPKKGKKPFVRAADKAVEEGRVVFVRNLPFATDDEAVKKQMAEFGEVKLALICKFADSGHSKGTAFIHFSTKEEADACLAAVMRGSIEVDGRTLTGYKAVPREEAARLEKEHLTKAPKDKRNLHLLRAGWIREGTSAAAGMSEEDAKKRAQLARDAKKKLENLHYFVSATRLAVHNLPFKLADKELRKICLESAGRPEAIIRECRIWKDMDKQDAKGNFKSRGFGFVDFAEHVDALACIKALNNNANTFTDQRRPIVEFCVENLQALKIKEKRKLNKQGIKVTGKELQEQVKKQVEVTKKIFSKGGQKPIPKFLGPKIRHRDQGAKKSKKSKPSAKSAKKPEAEKSSDKQPKSGGARKKNNKKEVAKYLALS